MRLSSANWLTLRKPLLAFAAFAAGLASAPLALAQDGSAVIVASSSPSHAVGHVIEAGETVSLETGATVTLMEEDGRISTLVRSGPFRPASAPTQRASTSIVASVAALVRADRSVRTPGGVRTLEQERTCSAANESADFEGLQRALAGACDSEAAAILVQMVEGAGPPELYVSLMWSRQARGRAIGVQAQANFPAYLYCRLRRDDASMSAVTPDPGALPINLVASMPYTIDFPNLVGESTGAVQCMAIGSTGLDEAPEIGDWPRELDPEHIAAGARVASVTVPIE